MKKSFDELTIADDFMFCKVMQNESICKEFLEMILADKIGKIAYLSSQDAVVTGSESKSIRLDVLVKDEAGKSYDIEMQVANEHNIPKRMRYYQAAIDISFLDKGAHYKALNDSYIIFVCLFDPVGKGKPLYTFENICLEDRQTPLQDGTKKIIINAEAFSNTEDANLKGFLEYLKTGRANTEFTGRIETMIQAVKHNEQARQEYRFMSAFEMDAREEGEARGFAKGVEQGFFDGAYQTKLETARLMRLANCELSFILKMTGLSKDEVESL